MREVYLVSCVSKKKSVSLPAKEFYDSSWFHKAREFVESTGSSWFILSAKYGLLSPQTIIQPYDETLNAMSSQERLQWSKKVLSDLARIIQPSDKIIILAGAKYREFLINELEKMCAHVEIPMKGLRIGQQLAWLARR